MKNENFKKIIRDWKIIISVFGVGLISLSVFGWWIYLSDKIAGGYLTPKVETSEMLIKTLDEKRLKSSLLILETKQADFLRLKEISSKLADPSL
jgi:hypothetical protein